MTTAKLARRRTPRFLSTIFERTSLNGCSILINIRQTFQSWYDKYEGDDFRRAVSFNINFLFKESIGVRDELRKQPIWSEVLEKDYIPLQDVKQAQTIVTPYVYECFEHLRFGHFLKSVPPTKTAHDRQAFQGNALHLTVDVTPSCPGVEFLRHNKLKIGAGPSKPPNILAIEIPAARGALFERRTKIKAIKPGDVLSVTKDGHGSIWKDEISLWKAADDCWYVYVQGVHESKRGERSFDVIWLYKPSDTSCAKMKYPLSKELFFSDNCSCSQSRIKEDEVIDLVTVSWHGQPLGSQKFFIRQTYLENDRFVTLADDHKICKHRRDKNKPTSFMKFALGQTVLVAQTDLSPPCRKSKYGLDPFEVLKYETSNLTQYAILRRLLRRNEIDKQSSCKPNELVYSDDIVKVELRKIERTCLVRFYSEAEVIGQTVPAPYSRCGTGNAFYITSRLIENDGNKQLIPIQDKIPPSLVQGFDPSKAPSRRKLRGLDLYCGGGNFGRGLEEGGAVHYEWAVDMDKIAIHTYFANLQDPQETKFYYGSVNDQLYQAIHGNIKNSDVVPRPGDVDFISAGSPCQGFSRLNFVNATQEKGLKNQSLVASVAAYVDFYRPKYGLLENVLAMAQKHKGRDEDVLSQLICAIVGMGYQLSTFMLDAWSCGSPQSRSRIFVAFTAPGYEPIPHPELTHSHPHYIGDRGLGRLANGKAFGERKRGPTPFNFVTAAKAVSDLPWIGDGRTYSCIPYPDHVMPSAVMEETKLQIQTIPIFPRKMSFWKAWNDGKGVMTKEQRALFPQPTTRAGKPNERVLKGSKGWGRINPDGLFGTITVAPVVKDSRMGTLLHWDQHRSLTVMEARRAQSFPDNEVVLGNPPQQSKIIGNSVDRSVALALGLSLREAWEKNPSDDTSHNSTAVLEQVSVISRRPQSSLTGGFHGQFSTSSNSPSFSDSSTSANSHHNDADGAAAGSHSPSSVRDWHGQLAKKKPDKAKQNKGKSCGSKPRPARIPSARIPSDKIIRGSYDSADSEDFSLENTSRSLEPASRRGDVFPSLEKSLPAKKTNNQSLSLKRSYTVIEQQVYPQDKSHKAPKLSAIASPSSRKTADTKTPATSGKDKLFQQSRSQPVDATHLNQKLQVVFSQHVADRADHSATDDSYDESEETDFSGFSTSDEDDDEIGQGNRPITQPNTSSTTHHRVISTSNQGKGKSPTNARTSNRFYIDLATVGKAENQPGPPRAKLPVRPAPQSLSLPRPAIGKYVPVDNSKFAAYAQTYATQTMTRQGSMVQGIVEPEQIRWDRTRGLSFFAAYSLA